VCALTYLSTFGAAAADPSAAPTAADTARAFGAREQVRQISLSPDGTRFAVLLSIKAHAQVLAVAPVDHPEQLKAVLNADGDPQTIQSCSWANDARLVCSIYTIQGKDSNLIGFSRLIAINPDGTDMKMMTGAGSGKALGLQQDGGNVIDWYGDTAGSTILITRQFVEEVSTGNLLANGQSGLGVERIDPMTLKRSIVERPNGAARLFITDGVGNVRITARRGTNDDGYLNSRLSYLYRRIGSRDWEPLGTTISDSQVTSGFRPIAIDSALNVAFGLDDANGRDALYKMALDGSGKRELVYANPEVDVDGLIQIGRKQRVVGVTYATDRRQSAFFDTALNKLSASLSKAIPQLPLISFVDSSADENRLVLWGGSDTNPGVYMVFDKQTRHLDKLLEARPELNAFMLAPVKSITYTASDGTQVPAYLTLPVGSNGRNLPAIVMPHGGPSARDEWGFDWLSQFHAARGYAVIQPNYRGSSGYGDKWFANNGFKSWRTAISDVNDAGRWLIQQGITTPDHLAIVGWSYGGYAALQSQVLDPDLFKAVVTVAPVTDLNALREEARGYDSFKLVDAFIGNGPHIRDGSPARHADVFKAPVLMFHGDRDQNVGIGESRLMADKLKSAGKSVELIEFAGLDHQLEDSDARMKLLSKSDAFLRAAMHLSQ
jgi:dipeptidyl aminopeptidase/acylaminoacyl peptidase